MVSGVAHKRVSKQGRVSKCKVGNCDVVCKSIGVAGKMCSSLPDAR